MRPKGVIHIGPKVLDMAPGSVLMDSIYMQYSQKATWSTLKNFKKEHR